MSMHGTRCCLAAGCVTCAGCSLVTVVARCCRQVFCLGLGSGMVEVTGVGYSVQGRFLMNGATLTSRSSPPVVRLLEVRPPT